MSIKYLTREQMLKLLKVARQSSERDYCAILLAYRHGLRASEVCSLTTNNIDSGMVTVKRLKGSEKTEQTLFESDEELLNERVAIIRYLKTIPENQRLFHMTRQHFYRLFNSYALQAGIPKSVAHPHAAKHAIAMELVDKIPINKLQKFLGHKSLSSTGMYTKVQDKDACAAVAAVMK